MSYVILQKGKEATEPYTVDGGKLAIYNLGQLCLYLYRNPLLCEIDLLKPSLALWLSEDCGLKDLGSALDTLRKKGVGPERFAYACFFAADYLEETERLQVCQQIKAYSTLSKDARKKMRADAYVEDERFKEAIVLYEELLLDNEDMDRPGKRQLYHNIGVAYAQMFYYDIAYGWFLKAANLDVEQAKDIRNALFCKRMSLDDAGWRDFLKHHSELASYAKECEEEIRLTQSKWQPKEYADVAEAVAFHKREVLEQRKLT